MLTFSSHTNKQGRWAGWGLKYCTLWSTNVVRDYLACTCPKIIIQVGVVVMLAVHLRSSVPLMR